MSSSTASPVRSVLNDVDSNPESPEVKGPSLPDQAELGSKNAPWYEEKSSNHRSLDISFIKEKGGNVRQFRSNHPRRTNGQGGDAEDDGGGGRGRLLGRCRAPKKGPKKRRASTQPKKEARREKKKKEEASTSGSRPERIPEEGRAPTPSKRTPEDGPKFTPIITIAEASSPKKKGPGRVPPLDYTEDSLVASPSGVVVTRYICNMAPDRDIDLLRRADDSEVQWRGGEVVRRLTRAHRAVTTTCRSFDEAMGQYVELVARLEELEALRVQEQRATETREEALEDRLAAEKAAREATKSELDAALAKKTSFEVELEETKARAEEEKSLRYFKDGFAGCLAQFRANGYSEEEHPAPFLDAKKALMEMPDEEAEEEEEEQGDADATPRAPPLNDCICILCVGRRPSRGDICPILYFVVGLFLEMIESPRSGEVAFRGSAIWNCALVPSWSGLCVCVEELREVVASSELGLSTQKATRNGGQCGTGLKCSGGIATRGGATAELGLDAELIGLLCWRRRATRVTSAELGFSARVGFPPEEVFDNKDHELREK
ncbi:hypothetical protein F511_03991 [Dorcoceras hygrometricum]|uniref:Uncharacterized protein n=1 Tax=Dorcoceras hygrometricum TaxID=472368 RepID=A0A2Z7ADV5_9LAMI|nr:hypothetical protein F511_03991 [Dorcoceras hygrometricum]